jgi:hypothetical protein
MTGQNGHKWDVLLVVTNDRYGSTQFDTVRRIIDATLRAGHSIQVWACGYANMLTEIPPDVDGGSACCEGDRPDAAAEIAELATENPDGFSWVACRSCSDDRGASEHVPAVLTAPGFADFRDYVDNAAKTVFIGGS